MSENQNKESDTSKSLPSTKTEHSSDTEQRH